MTTPFGSGFIPGDVPGFSVHYLTQQDFLDLAERLLPQGYVDGLKVNGGWEFYQGLAKMFERISLAIGRYELSQYILSAPRGARATCDVEFFRPVAVSAPQVTMLKGTIVKCSNSGRFFSLVNDVVLGANVFTASGSVVAVAPGFEYNVKGPYTTPAGELIVGEIDAIELPLMDPPFGDPTIGVRQTTDATGGVAAVLEQLALDAGFTPDANESDAQIRARLRQTPSIIDPESIDRAVAYYVKRIGVGYTIIETWDPKYQTCYDGPEVAVGDYDPDLFCLDDPRQSPPFRNRLLSERDLLASFFVTVPNLVHMTEYGFAYDDPAVEVIEHQTALGRRAVAALDVPDVDTPSELYLTPVIDGDDFEKNSFYKGLYQLLQSVKCYGVSADVELDNDDPNAGAAVDGGGGPPMI